MLTQMCSNRAIVDSLECCMDDLVECFEDFVKKSLILIFLGIGVIVGLLCYLLKMVSERPPLNNSTFVPENSTHTRSEVNEMINNKKNKKLEQEVNEKSKLKENEYIKTDKTDKIDKTDKTDKTDKIDKTNKTDKIDNNLDILDTEIDKNTTAINASNVSIPPFYKDNVLRDIGLTSCSKHICGGGSSTHIYTPSRVPIPSLPTSSSKHKLTPCLRKRSSNRSNVPSLQICPKVTKPGSCCSMCCYDEAK